MQLDQLWQQRLERAAFNAERAGRHYHLVEPENRLVARQLAKEWEETLTAHQQLQEDYQRFAHEQPKQLSAQQRRSIQELAENLPRLWSAETTTQAQRKAIIRQVIQSIQVRVEGESEHVNVIIEWVGGATTQAQIIRPVAKWSQLSYYPQLCERLRQLVEEGWSINDITEQLNQDGFRPPKQRQTFNRDCTRRLMQQLGISSTHRQKNHDSLAQHEWWLADLALSLAMPSMTLYDWVQRGWVQAKQHPDSRRWIIWADEHELERLKRHRQQAVGHILRQRWQGNIPEIASAPDNSESPKL